MVDLKKRLRSGPSAVSSGVPTGWRMGFISLKHNEVGGVTVEHFGIERAVRDGSPDMPSFDGCKLKSSPVQKREFGN